MSDGMLLDPQARSNLYRFLAATYLRPLGEEAVQYLTSKGVVQELRSVFGERAMPALRSLQNDLVRNGDGYSLEQEFMDLFAVPGGRYVTPFEDVYRGATADRKLGPLLGERAIAARRLYREAGGEVDTGCRQLPTHIGVQLAFMGFLCSREAAALAGGDEEISLAPKEPCQASARIREIQARFLAEHLNGWFPELSQAIQARARSGIYRGLALLTETFLAEETDLLLGVPSDLRTGTH